MRKTKSTNRTLLPLYSWGFLFCLSPSFRRSARASGATANRSQCLACQLQSPSRRRSLSSPPRSPTAILPRFFRVRLPQPAPPPLLVPTAVNLRGGLAAPPVPKGPAAKRNGGKQPARIQSGGGIGFHPLDKLPPIGFFLPFVGAPPSRCWCGGRAARARNWKAGATGSSVWFAGVRFSRMGAIMCCFRGPRDDAPGCCCLPWPFLNNIHNNNSNHNSGAPARPRAPSRVAPVQERVPPAGSRQDDSMNTFRCPPRPLPYDDPQFRHQTEHHPLVSGHDKASTQSQKSILLEESNDAATRSTCADEKADGPSLKADSGGKKVGGAQVCVPSDCEDDCPICLEEYDYENPKIVLQCNHNFHLSCIYEWMERSQSCAVCAKVMLFKEGQ